VLRLFSRLNVGGPAVHVILLTAGLKARGYTTCLAVGRESPREGNLLDLAAAKGVECLQLGSLGRDIRLVSDVRAFWGVWRILRQFRPHIVHTHTAKAGVLGRIAARLAGVPVIVHTYHGHVLRSYFGPVRNALFRGLERVLGWTSDALVAVSQSVKDDLVTLGVADAAKIRVVPLGLELGTLTGTLTRGRLRTESGVANGVPLIGVVGRLAPVKDLPTFLAAARLVRRAVPQARFAIVGDGEERSALEASTAGLSLQDVVHFHGWHRDMAAVYGDLDVVVNCSRNEGTPVALIEALAAGRSVVATNVGGTPDLLARGEHGLLVPAGDPEALAAAIVDVLQAPDAARARAARGRAYVLGQHSAERLVDDVDHLYRQLLRLPVEAA
jgi:glycosyltransferase involved in cell wall biosynthesis